MDIYKNLNTLNNMNKEKLRELNILSSKIDALERFKADLEKKI